MNPERCHSTHDWWPLWWEGASTAVHVMSMGWFMLPHPANDLSRIAWRRNPCKNCKCESPTWRSTRNFQKSCLEKNPDGQNCWEQIVFAGSKSEGTSHGSLCCPQFTSYKGWELGCSKRHRWSSEWCADKFNEFAGRKPQDHGSLIAQESFASCAFLVTLVASIEHVPIQRRSFFLHHSI